MPSKGFIVHANYKYRDIHDFETTTELHVQERDDAKISVYIDEPGAVLIFTHEQASNLMEALQEIMDRYDETEEDSDA